MTTWRKGIAEWTIGDTLYLSVPFTWLLEEAQQRASLHRGRVVAGGPAVSLCGAPWAITDEPSPIEPLLLHNPCATFTTRGCPNACAFCAVPRIEGEFRELTTWRPAPVICDNNLLAASRAHFERVVDSLRPFRAVDFNQGLEARLLRPWHLDLLRQLRVVKLRFAADTEADVQPVSDAIAMARRHGFREFGVYCLVGWQDTPASAIARLEAIRALGVRPTPMRYQPLDATARNAYVPAGWTVTELRRITRYYSRLCWLEHIPFADYEVGEHSSQMEMMFGDREREVV